jgi:hypothetical protein
VKRTFWLFAAVVCSLALFVAYAVLFIDGPLKAVSDELKACALIAVTYVSAVVGYVSTEDHS